MNINTTTTKNIVKISSLLFAVIVLSILYAMIVSGSHSDNYVSPGMSSAFKEGNECMDIENKAKSKIMNILNTPIANASGDSRITQQDMISKIQKIKSDVDNGTGDFEGNTRRCFPSSVKMNMDLDMDPDIKIQKIQSVLTPEKKTDKSNSSST